MKSYLLIIFINSCLVSLIWGQCRTCSQSQVNSMICVSETEYQFCNGINLIGDVNTCPTDYICSINGLSPGNICHAIAGNVDADCAGCNVCSDDGLFACTGQRTFALCLGGNVPSTTQLTCGSNLVCNRDLPTICGSPNDNVATCSTTSGTTTTTVLPPVSTPPSTLPTYAQYVCQQMRVNTRFAFPIDVDRTCKRYIYCFLTTTGTWSGQIYTCPGSTYYNPRTKLCSTTLPTGCSL